MTTDSGNYAARATALRETAKWMAAIFAGAGAVLFSGLSFTNIEKAAAADNWILPVILAVIPVLAAAVAVGSAARVIGTGTPDAGAMLDDSRDLPEAIRSLRSAVEKLRPATVATYGGVEGFLQRVADVRAQVDEAEAVYSTQRTADYRKARDAEYERMAGLQDGVRDLLLCADFVQVEKRYRRARWTMLAAACAAVAGAAASGVVTARVAAAPADQVSSAAITSPLDVHVYLRPDYAQGPCPVDDGQRATAIGGTLAQPLLLLPAVPAGRDAPDTCRIPWTWAPPSAAVVVVPANNDGNP